MDKVDNLEEELIKTKKNHAFVSREVSILRTKIKVLEKEVKKKDQTIEDLLKNDQFTTKSEQKLQINSLKRKIIQLEQNLKNKTEEVAKLLSDRNVAKAAETRHQLDQLNIECVRLKKHLSQSVPEADVIREKNQYMDILGQLIEENVWMRKMIGELKNNQQEPKSSVFDEESLMMEMKNLALTKKNETKYYKDALNSLINQRNSMSQNGRNQKPPIRSRSVNKKLPIRSKPIPTKTAVLRSKSIETFSKDNTRRLSRQLSDANLTNISQPNSETENNGHDIMMPIQRNIRNHMYRHAFDSDSSNSETETIQNIIEDDLPTELYDADGNVYYVQPEIDEERKLKSTDTWLDLASMLSDEAITDEV